jgi:hypothetical protein
MKVEVLGLQRHGAGADDRGGRGRPRPHLRRPTGCPSTPRSTGTASAAGGMDGVGGLNQPQIQPGETYVYEFTLRQHGTHMYHPHADEMVQMAMGMMGLFIIHPRGEPERIDRDYCILLHNWASASGNEDPDPSVMLEFDLWTFNGKVFPASNRWSAGSASACASASPTCRMTSTRSTCTATRSGSPRPTAGAPALGLVAGDDENVMSARPATFEFVADNPGDWALHCHKTHHTMNAMGHEVPNMIGVDQRGVSKRDLAPARGLHGDGLLRHGRAPATPTASTCRAPNTLPMMMGKGPFGPSRWAACSRCSRCATTWRRATTAIRAGTAIRRAPSAHRIVSSDPDFGSRLRVAVLPPGPPARSLEGETRRPLRR